MHKPAKRAVKPRRSTNDYDVREVKEAARGRCIAVLRDIGGIPEAAMDGRHHPCPKCGGSDRFRLIDAEAGAVYCNQCFSENNGDVIAAVRWLLGIGFREALQLIGDYLRLEPKKRMKGVPDPAASLRFSEWNDGLAALACLYRDPIRPESLRRSGALLATYRSIPVVALPVRVDAKSPDSRPVGFVLLHGTGGKGKLPRFDRKGNVIGLTKAKLAYGSKPGWIGPIERVPEAETVWKCEGATDMLALNSVLPAGHVAISNASGSREKPTPEHLRLLEGKRVVVVHDADPPGAAGAARWVQALVPIAAEVRHVRLPYPIDAEPVDGELRKKDVRDFLCERNETAVADLLALVDQTTPATIPAELLLQVIEADDDPHRLAQVLRLSEFAGGPVRYWREEWYVWRRGAWERESDSDFRPLVNLAIKHEYDRLHLLEQEKEGDEVGTVRKVTPSLVSSVMQALAGLVCLPHRVLWNTLLTEPESGQRNWIAMSNGILQLDRCLTGADDCLVPHTPEWWSRVRLPYAFDEDARCPKWRAFLERNLEGDRERIAILQEWLGYLLLAKTDLVKFLMLEGDGANGKSVICAVAEALVGQDNATHVPLECFGQRFALSPTLGKLLNVCSEIGEVDRVAEGILKQYAAGEPMMFDRKNKEPIEARPTARLMFATNNRPRFSDKSEGLWRRIILFPLNVRIEPHERVLGMDRCEWWLEQGEMPGILAWAIVGLDRLLRSKRFSESEVVKRATAEYRQDSNPVAIFLEERCELSPTRTVRCERLYRAYSEWCVSGNYRPLCSQTFGRELRRQVEGLERRKAREESGGRHYAGVGLLNEGDA